MATDVVSVQRERRRTFTSDRDRPNYYLSVIESDSRKSVMGEADGPSESPVRAPIRGHDFGNPQTHASIRSATCCQPTSSIMSCPIRGKISASDR